MEGDQMKMREALEAINYIDTRGLKRLLCELVEADIFDGGQINKTISAVEKARRALSTPPRQCDVGTAEEQSLRFNAFCMEHHCDSDTARCKCKFETGRARCELAWAQTPYAEEGAGK